MNRRSFLKGVGVAGLGFGAIGSYVGFVGNKVSFSKSINIKLYQSKEISQWLEDNGLGKDFWISSLEYLLPQTYNRTFPDLDVNIVKGSLDIPISSGSDIARVGYREKELSKWFLKAKSSTDINPVKHSNVMIRGFPSEESFYDYGGVGFPSYFPTATKLYNGYSMVWIDPENINIGNLHKLVAHESGHNLGMFHKHGCNVEFPTKGRSLMLSGDYLKNNDTNMFGQNIEDMDNWVARFNPKLEMKHLRI